MDSQDLEPAPTGQARKRAARPARGPRIAVVIPCFRAAATIRAVIAAMPALVDRVYVVDDGCPEGSGDRAAGTDPRVVVLRNPRNLGVGSAVKRGYAEALRDGAVIVVKVDADGQMDPALIPRLVAPILSGRADYAKGNRFAPLHRMPAGSAPVEHSGIPPVRRFGNNILSFVHKGVTGYWNIVDPTNGFTAIHRRALESIDLPSVADGYFFETDMLFQLNLANAVVQDVPLPILYAGEVSSLSVRRVALRYPFLALRRFLRRIVAKYFVQDFNVASIELAAGVPLVVAGTGFGLCNWIESIETGIASTAGTVMLAALPIIIGFQMILSAVSYDILHLPSDPISRRDEE